MSRRARALTGAALLRVYETAVTASSSSFRPRGVRA